MFGSSAAEKRFGFFEPHRMTFMPGGGVNSLTAREDLVAVDKPRLRSALKKLSAARYGDDLADTMSAPQEILDFLAMLAGLKPVYLLGRGMDVPSGVADVSRIAVAMGLHVELGPYWTTASRSALPPWLVAINAENDAAKQAVYISKARAVAQEVAAINADGGRASPSTEARLLGYPECCVASHHEEVAKVERLFALLLERVGAGDEVRMRRLVADDVAMAPETEEEIKLAQSFAAPRQISFTSINACAACAGDLGSPARQVAARYRALAETVDPEFARRIGMAGFGGDPHI
jgi:hypothetical protein